MEKNSAILVSCMVVILVILLMFQGPISLIFQPNAIEIPTTRNNGALSSMRFERNDGQTDPQVDFILRGRDHHLLFSPTSVRFNGIHPGSGIADPVHFSSIEIHFVNAHPDAVVRGLDRLITRSNYFIGNDPERWNTDIPNFARIRYDGIYDGIDLVYYNNGETLEFDYVVAP